MGTAFWVRRFFTVLAGAFVIIFGVQMLKGYDLSYSLVQAAIWGPLSAIVFIFSRFFQARRGQHCAICKDTPEMRSTSGGGDGS
ncbi:MULTISPECIES: hypothetical protein [unclassified Microbulbifer]|uniref:hypothetical protein n=1 Tax=unclassified Microbulbifer TaxID=2619833 RepID=UPI0027E41C1C|nr:MULTISPECIES: hypothetical protein [unclassified Microbulbifer]